MRARWNDPAVGRFISEDPGRDGGNWFWYAYCNPVGGVDRTGRMALDGATLSVGMDAEQGAAVCQAAFGALAFIGAVICLYLAAVWSAGDGGYACSQKKDIKFIRHIGRQFGLDDDELELLHEDITGQNLSNEDIRQAARDIVQGRGGSRLPTPADEGGDGD
jgi:hypothetical protein